MIDINKTIDLVKLKFYQEWLYSTHLYDEGDSQFHKNLTEQVVTTYVDPLNLPKTATILDLGCGPGYFLDEMKARGYTGSIGVTLSKHDATVCAQKGHTIKQYDLSFLPQSDGFVDESVDFIFLRHALEHSPYPIFSLMEYNRVLKQGGKIYIEVPAPDCDRRHEFNLNHYSILGSSMLTALLNRTGFAIDAFNLLEFDLSVPKSETESMTMREKYYCIVATKQQPIDVK